MSYTDTGKFPNSVMYRIGFIHSAWDAAKPAGMRQHYHPEYAASWMYRRGFARAGRLARGLAPLPVPERNKTSQQQGRHDLSGRLCWCWQRHQPPNSYQQDRAELAAKMADPDRISWAEKLISGQ